VVTEPSLRGGVSVAASCGTSVSRETCEGATARPTRARVLITVLRLLCRRLQRRAARVRSLGRAYIRLGSRRPGAPWLVFVAVHSSSAATAPVSSWLPPPGSVRSVSRGSRDRACRSLDGDILRRPRRELRRSWPGIGGRARRGDDRPSAQYDFAKYAVRSAGASHTAHVSS